MYQDKMLVCQECGKKFIFTDQEQEFYASKGSLINLNGVQSAEWLENNKITRGNTNGKTRCIRQSVQSAAKKQWLLLNLVVINRFIAESVFN